MKICSKCKIEKFSSEFPNRKISKDGLDSWCKSCRFEQHKQWYSANKVTINQKRRLREQNRSLIEQEAKKVFRSQYYTEHKDILAKNHKERCRVRYNTDINYKLAHNLRTRLNQALIKDYKSGSAVRDLGCSIEFLKQYLQFKFLPGMTWSNHGFGKDKWNIDHIKPLSSFDLTDREQLLNAVHYTNLQPMWQPENILKGKKL